MQIERIEARQILDSRGTPTVEAEIWLSNGVSGRAAVPSGASTGAHEAHELRDGGQAYGGKGVQKAVNNIRGEIADCLRGLMADDQFLLDSKLIELDGTPNKSRLGANSILAVSLACAHAAANARQLPLYRHLNDIAGNPDMSLPMPMMNVLNGGQHATMSSDFQEFMLVPKSAKSFAAAMQMAAEVVAALKKQLAAGGHSTAVGDEGGFTYPVKANTEMLEFLMSAISAVGYIPGQDICFALDVAGSELFQDQQYVLKAENRKLTAAEMIDYLEQISKNFPVVSVEDGLAEDEWQAWQDMTQRLNRLQLVGDDLIVTNADRLQKAINLSAGNAVLIKPNQIGTLTETIKTINLAKANNWNVIISHRSGETEDVTIAHLAVGIGAGQIKSGGLTRTERLAKYNEILRIEAANPELALSKPF